MVVSVAWGRGDECNMMVLVLLLFIVGCFGVVVSFERGDEDVVILPLMLVLFLLWSWS